MLTNTHILVGTALLGRKKFSKAQNLAIVFGGLLPDLSVVLMVFVSRFPGFQTDNLWRRPNGLYWQEPWQFLSALSNSIPLYAFLLLITLVLVKQHKALNKLWVGLTLFFATCLLHVLADFPVHAEDAHVHFWPLTDARFHSPISYWDRRYYGDIVGFFEALFGIWLAIIVWRRFDSLWPRIGVVLLTLPFILSLGFSLFAWL